MKRKILQQKQIKSDKQLSYYVLPEKVHVEHRSRQKASEQIEEEGDEHPAKSDALCPHKQPVHLREVSDCAINRQVIVVPALHNRNFYVYTKLPCIHQKSSSSE